MKADGILRIPQGVEGCEKGGTVDPLCDRTSKQFADMLSPTAVYGAVISAELVRRGCVFDSQGSYPAGGIVRGLGRTPAYADVFGESSILGFVSGPLNNTGALFGRRYTVVSKSLVTGGWNDANSSGFFGERLRKSDYDAIYISDLPKAGEKRSYA